MVIVPTDLQEEHPSDHPGRGAGNQSGSDDRLAQQLQQLTGIQPDRCVRALQQPLGEVALWWCSATIRSSMVPFATKR